MSLLEISLKVNGYNIDEAEREIKKVQSLSPSEFKQWQEKMKWDIVKYHLANNDFYKYKLGNKLPEKWEDVPILYKNDYQTTDKKLISNTFTKKELYSGYTSGSSGHPFNFAKDKFCHALTNAIRKDRFKLYGLTLGSKQARFYGIPFERFDYMIEKTKDFLSNRVRFPVFDLSDEVLDSFIEKFRKTKFDYINGYSTAIVYFARYLIKKKIKLKDVCPTLKVCLATSENCTEKDKKIIFEGLGIPAVNEYGTSEVDLIAFEDLIGNWILSDETMFIEVIDDDGNQVVNGGEGKLLLTSLRNKAMPFIRYEIGDMAVIAPGKEKVVIKELLGGQNDDIILPSGKVATGFTFYYLTRDILDDSGVLKEYIIKQVATDKFILEIVSEADVPNEVRKLIQKKIDTYLEPGLSFEIQRVDKIERTKAGKMKHFHSLIK